jgi:hypothetical protein
MQRLEEKSSASVGDRTPADRETHIDTKIFKRCFSGDYDNYADSDI